MIDTTVANGIQLNTNGATVTVDSAFIFGTLGDGIQSIDTNLIVDGAFLGFDQTNAARPIGQDGIEIHDEIVLELRVEPFIEHDAATPAP